MDIKQLKNEILVNACIWRMIKTTALLWQENTHRYLSLDFVGFVLGRETVRGKISVDVFASYGGCCSATWTHGKKLNVDGTFVAVYLWYKWSERAKVWGNTPVGLFYDYNTCRLLVVIWWEQHGLILFIFQVLAFFSARLEQHPDQTLSVGVVLDVIKQGALQWPRDRLKVTSLLSKQNTSKC